MSDALIMTGRSIRLSRRNVDALMMAMALPVMLLLIFVYFFGGAINTGTEYVTYVVPGVLLLCAGFGSASTAVAVAEDLKGGIIDRFRSLDIGGTPILAGHVLASTARNLIATALVFALAFAIGFRPSASPGGWLAAIGLLVAYIAALSWLSAAVGLLVKSPEAAGGFTFFVSFLPYPSSAFVPTDTMPSWLQGFAAHQPVTHVIEAVRGLLLGQPVSSTGWVALAWCTGILAASVAVSGALFKRRTA
ncbi:multidrug ABC transporter permease [Streptomyces agglomeratus]|uniref:Transport permease protein n=1 Tax=Streptomyces agglomeratus TaxID=285458 RepID=A0A1E5P145_9ACTN|nr:ABC transporter permease [Streptomyces agglomeratus]OEJ23271.1 multidrug ABC transporter permease [Streptomyces agglomeratus]OEJ42843.1 multidrug ABC transporter permease [Streptomyces agglomeratus]OEJ55223.1 multidrug ABC transporter permease [Streptomyces agglomeratus]OEJ62597.1 multidrug ABC transporter permease [Streptomyces agglomeratus]